MIWSDPCTSKTMAGVQWLRLSLLEQLNMMRLLQSADTIYMNRTFSACPELWRNSSFFIVFLFTNGNKVGYLWPIPFQWRGRKGVSAKRIVTIWALSLVQWIAWKVVKSGVTSVVAMNLWWSRWLCCFQYLVVISRWIININVNNLYLNFTWIYWH